MLCFIIALSAIVSFESNDSYAAYTEGTISGTTGLGTEESPVCVNTALELKQALEHSEITYVRVTNTISERLSESPNCGWNTLNNYYIAVSTNKILQIDATVYLYSEYASEDSEKLSSLITVTGGATLTLTGDGKLQSEFAGSDSGVKAVVNVHKGTLVANGPDIGVVGANKWMSFGHAIVGSSDSTIIVNNGKLYGQTYNNTQIQNVYNLFEVFVYAIKTSGTLTINDGHFLVNKLYSEYSTKAYFPIYYNDKKLLLMVVVLKDISLTQKKHL